MPQNIIDDKTNIWGLTWEQYWGLNQRYKQLRDQGLSQEDATSRLRGELESSGVYQQAQAAYQWQPAAQPTQPVQQPVQTQQPVSQPEPQPTVQPTIQPKTEKTVDFNVWSGRENEIVSNLNEWFKNAPELFKDQNTFRNAYGYNSADESKRRVLDAYFQAKTGNLGTQDGIFQALSTNQPIFNKDVVNTPAFQSAKARFDTLQVNKGLSAAQIADKLKNGDLTIWSPEYNDLQAINPSVLQQAEQLNNVNTGLIKQTPRSTIETNVGNNLTSNMPKNEIPNYQKMLSENKDVQTALAQSRETWDKISQLQDNLDNLEEDIRSQYQGKASEWYIQALISEKSKPIVRQLSALSRTYSSQVANLQYYSGLVKEDYESQKESFKTQQQQAFQERMDERNFAQQVALTKLQNQFQQSRDIQNYEQDLKKIGIQNAFSIDKDKLNFEQQKALESIRQKYANSKDLRDFEQQKSLLEFKSLMDNQATTTESGETFLPPAGKTNTRQIGNKMVTLDSNALNAYSEAFNAMQQAWLTPVTGSTFRTWAEQAKLYERFQMGLGGIAAKPGTSKHESGLGIDLYSNNKLQAPTKEQIDIMAQYGWKHANIPGDLGHFEYTWVIKQPQQAPKQTGNLALYRSYVEEGKVPAVATLKSLWMTFDQFIQQADEWYNTFLQQKASEYNSTSPTINIEYIPQQFSSISATQKEKLNESLAKIGDMDNRMNQLITLFKEYGTEILPTKAKTQMSNLREQILLKGKELENLWVLNGPDLGILSKIFPETNAFFSFNENTLKSMETIRDNYRTDAKTKAINYGARLNFKDNWSDDDINNYLNQ